MEDGDTELGGQVMSQRLTEPTKATRVYLAKRAELHKQLKKEIREAKKAEREAKRASQ